MAIRILDTILLLIGRLIVKGIFLFFRLIFCIVQTISWKIFGIQDAVEKNKDPKSKPVAQALKVLASWKYCLLMPPSLRDFICVHDEYIDPEYVIQNDHVSLFFLDPHQDVAVFGEGIPGQKLWHSDCDSFISLALFKFSKRLIVMPMEEFHKVCARLPDPEKPLIIMGNTARCGSTLLTQIFECTNKVISYSEPYPLNNLGAMFHKKGHCAEVTKLARSLLKMYLRPLDCMPDVEGYLLKPSGPSFVCAKAIKEVHAKTTVFYLYRDMECVTKSMYKLSFVLPTTRMCYLFCRLNGNLVEAAFRNALFPTEGTNRVTDNDYCSGIFQAAIASNVYLKMRKEDKDVHGLLFDDLLQDKEKGVRAILKICRLPESLFKDAMVAFTRDSQRNSIVSKEVFAAIKPLEYTEEDKKKSNQLLKEFGYPPIDQPCRIDGTLDFDEILGN
ncbi:hypothetical protein CAPTEDRAFT_210444 [Capitella teleta]|uniref:Sulfotransferase domain-containing protein n=1 Tax=Capitella teleta TaxID=283909 RepID=R7TRS5_CAPTE|nr:hypothetical protein CAPTEDRAFT_210443 [Capitella teleta]ELT96629.1 hypothetical protein CAPTEDRAFT_210444 [Capitella teleta]|eukprot:ELT96628.1 hypothetical protein CAPTEDRAFT_210443 [Capitella teleta]